MQGLATGTRPARLLAADILVLACGGVYFLAVGSALAGVRSPVLIPLLLAPAPLFLYALARRTPLTTPQVATLWSCAGLLTAVAVGAVVSVNPLAGLGMVGLAVSGFACARFPGPAVVVVFVAASAYGTLEAYAHVSGQRVVDPLLAGLWLAALWSWLITRRGRGAWIWPGVALLALYILLTAAEILTSGPVVPAAQSFRASGWYMAAALLVGYAPWPPDTRAAVTRALVVAAALVGAYTVFRWAVGPGGPERALAERFPNNFLDGDLRPVGTFPTTKELASWAAIILPFLAGTALVTRGRWRFAAAAAVVACTIAMLAADVRAGPAAAAVGLAVVIVLYQLAPAFSGSRGGTALVGVTAAVLIAGLGFTLTLAGKSDTAGRYDALLSPTSDPSYQARLIKWRAALDDISDAPFGHGLGTAGSVQARYGRFRTIGSIDVDNSYLKVAYEQGFAVMVMAAAAFVLLLLGLARRALVATDPARAGPAVAACGTLTAMLVIFYVGDYIEGLRTLAGWIVVGLGIAAVSAEERA